MTRGAIFGSVDKVRGKVERLEGRLLQLQGQLQALRGQAKRTSEPAFSRALERAKALQKNAANTRRGLTAGLRAGREAYRSPRPR